MKWQEPIQIRGKSRHFGALTRELRAELLDAPRSGRNRAQIASILTRGAGPATPRRRSRSPSGSSAGGALGGRRIFHCGVGSSVRAR